MTTAWEGAMVPTEDVEFWRSVPLGLHPADADRLDES